jgi:thiol-disulfide isomerase/thioredoxin
MATTSSSIDLGSSAKEFRLPDTVTGKVFSLSELKGSKGTVIMFICNHCPYVKHVNKELIRIATDFKTKGVSFIAISSNDAVQYPEDGPEEMLLTAQRLGYPFPYLYDESQDVAKSFNAVCTPDIFVYDANLFLVYHGQIDGSRPKNNILVTGSDLRNALLNLIAGKSPATDQKPSVGCSIKWKT